MGFLNFLKTVFSPTTPEEEDEFRKLRAKHGITTEEEEAVKKQAGEYNQPGDPDYDVWEDLRNYRLNFFLGSWVTRKFRPIGEDKLKKRLDELEKRRQEEEARRRGEGKIGDQ
jgi:hypothetical protein